MEEHTEEYLLAAHRASAIHKTVTLKSEICGCFFCETTFLPQEIECWVDERNGEYTTAICPYCGIDTVLGSASGFPVTDKKFLKSMHKRWFEFH